jgi:hypothetical protein
MVAFLHYLLIVLPGATPNRENRGNTHQPKEYYSSPPMMQGDDIRQEERKK